MVQGLILVDTTVIIDYLRSNNRLSTLFYKLVLSGNNLCISSITEFEVRRGITIMNADFTEKLLEPFEILPFDSDCAKKASEIYINLKTKSKIIDFPDLTIGATALSHNIPMATHNLKHFDRIDGLRIWE